MDGTGARVRHLPVGRSFFVDERGVGLRASWHHDRGIANLSVWRGDRCHETFHLPMAEAPRLIGFLAEGLAAAAVPSDTAEPVTVPSSLHAVAMVANDQPRASLAIQARAALVEARQRLAELIAPD